MRYLSIIIVFLWISAAIAIAATPSFIGLVSGGGATSLITETLYPTVATGGNNWTNYAYVSYLADSNDATYMSTYAQDTSQRFTFPAPTACPNTINKITLISRAYKGGSSPTIDGAFRSNSYWSAINHYGGVHNFMESATEYSDNFLTGPSGGKWTQSEISENSFGFRTYTGGTYSNGVSEARVTEFKMVVTCD